MFPIILFGKSFLISNIPLPKIYIQNLDPYKCNKKCLQSFMDTGMIFSFLAHSDSKLENKGQEETRMMNANVLNIGSQTVNNKVKIALLLPHKIIGKYTASTTNASFAYLIAKNRAFELKSYQIESESAQEIAATLEKIKRDGFNHVIAPLTQEGANAVSRIDPKLYVYFPTVNKKDTQESSSYLYYGGIDYRLQSDKLLKKAHSPLVIFYDQSAIGNKLATYEEERFKNDSDTGSQNVIKLLIPTRTTNLETQLKNNGAIQYGSFFLNTPIVKSAMIMSQITLYGTKAANILSTQINYDPLMLSMTQYKDRKNMIIANSITQNSNLLIETNALLENDIMYDWINYTTTVGIDFFFNQITNDEREYNIAMKENQMIYPIELMQPSVSRFVTYESKLKE